MDNIKEIFVDKCEFSKACAPELRVAVFSDISKHLRYQCNTCGKTLGTPVSKKGININSLSLLDENKEKKFYDKIEEESGVIERRMFLELVDKEHKFNRAQCFEELFGIKYKYFGEAYNLYINSIHWKSKRLNVLKRDNYKCRICKEKDAVDVHHLSYANLFAESELELLSVCRQCHELIHGRIIS